MSQEFNEFIQEIADGIKRTVGPLSPLFNPQSTKAAATEVADLKARVERQDRLIDIHLDTIEQLNQKLRSAETERDALRVLVGQPLMEKKKKGKND